jgi:hypothetical protein
VGETAGGEGDGYRFGTVGRAPGPGLEETQHAAGGKCHDGRLAGKGQAGEAASQG